MNTINEILNSIDILYEDNEIIVVEKPGGVPVQADKTGDINMITILNNHIKKENSIWLVHRLDRPVCGVMIFAKTDNSAKTLSKYLVDKKIQKQYLAVVCGQAKEKDTLTDFLIKNERLNISKVVQKNTPKAKEAVLEYECLNIVESKDGILSLLKINLITGRHHQIRVQLSNEGLPLWGDTKYNEKFKRVGSFVNLALMSYRLIFPHPKSGKILEFTLSLKNEYPYNVIL